MSEGGQRAEGCFRKEIEMRSGNPECEGCYPHDGNNCTIQVGHDAGPKGRIDDGINTV